MTTLLESTEQLFTYLTERTKSPLMDVLSRTRKTPLSLSAFRILLISSRDIIPMNQLQHQQPQHHHQHHPSFIIIEKGKGKVLPYSRAWN